MITYKIYNKKNNIAWEDFINKSIKRPINIISGLKINDGYYDSNWVNDIVKNRILYKDRFFIIFCDFFFN